jgi:hypothetical protein
MLIKNHYSCPEYGDLAKKREKLKGERRVINSSTK